MEYNEYEIMTLTDVAKYLKLAERTILKMAHKNEIPCFKIANQWRFLKPVINDWLTSKLNVLPQNDFTKMLESEINILPISRIINEKLFIPDLKGAAKEDILLNLIQPLLSKKIIKTSDKFLEKLLERESMLSTGLGKGIAIPHIRDVKKNPEGGPYIVIGINKAGVNFNSLDNQPVYLFFLLCTNSEVVHLRIMSQLAKIFSDQELINKIIVSENFQYILRSILKKEHEINYLNSFFRSSK